MWHFAVVKYDRCLDFQDKTWGCILKIYFCSVITFTKHGDDRTCPISFVRRNIKWAYNYKLFYIWYIKHVPMSPRRALEVQHLKYPSFLLHSEKQITVWAYLNMHPKRKGNISIEKGIRSKVKCRSSAHFPSIWVEGNFFIWNLLISSVTVSYSIFTYIAHP